MIFTVAFWKGAGERALKTFLQAGIAAFIGTLGLSVTGGGFNVLAHLALLAQAGEVGAGFGLGAAILSLCTSLGNASFTAGQPVAVLEPASTSPAPVVNINTAPSGGQGQVEPLKTVEPPRLAWPPLVEAPQLDDPPELSDPDAGEVIDEEDPADEPEPAPGTPEPASATTA